MYLLCFIFVDTVFLLWGFRNPDRMCLGLKSGGFRGGNWYPSPNKSIPPHRRKKRAFCFMKMVKTNMNCAPSPDVFPLLPSYTWFWHYHWHRTWSVPSHIPLPPLYLRCKAALNPSWLTAVIKIGNFGEPASASSSDWKILRPWSDWLFTMESGSDFLQWTWHGSRGELPLALCLKVDFSHLFPLQNTLSAHFGDTKWILTMDLVVLTSCMDQGPLVNLKPRRM